MFKPLTENQYETTPFPKPDTYHTTRDMMLSGFILKYLSLGAADAAAIKRMVPGGEAVVKAQLGFMVEARVLFRHGRLYYITEAGLKELNQIQHLARALAY